MEKLRVFNLRYFIIEYKQNPIWALMYLAYSDLVSFVEVTGCDKEVINWAKENCKYEANRRCKTKNGCKRWYMETLVIPFEDKELQLSNHKKLIGIMGEKEYQKLEKDIKDRIKDRIARYTGITIDQ